MNRHQADGIRAGNDVTQVRVVVDGNRIAGRLRALDAGNDAVEARSTNANRYGRRARNEQVGRDDICAVQYEVLGQQLPERAFDTAAVEFRRVTHDGNLVVELF